LGVDVGLGTLEAGAGIRERRHGRLENFSLKLELITHAVNELEGEILVIHRATDGSEIISNPLQFAGVGDDREISAWGAAESLAEVEVP
jgi:hypothetical protein